MAKTVAKLPWDARAAPLHLLARLYLIVRSDFERWRVAKALSDRPAPRRRAADTSFFYPPPQGDRPEPRRRAVDAPVFCPLPQDCLADNELLIKGIRRDGKTFRPSDWAERLCGAAVVFFPGATSLSGARSTARPYHGYAAYVRPAIISGVYCVIIDARLRDLEPRAWDYVTGFARDNDLVMHDAADLAAAAALPEMSRAAA